MGIMITMAPMKPEVNLNRAVNQIEIFDRRSPAGAMIILAVYVLPEPRA